MPFVLSPCLLCRKMLNFLVKVLNQKTKQMTPIKFGTDGWRAIIADDYTVENVQRVATATSKWILEQNGTDVVLGHDCRFGGALFAEAAARILGAHGLRVHLAKGFVSTPMVSLGIVKVQAAAGVVITASHNPPSYNGFKLKSAYGGPTIPKDIARVEALIPDTPPAETPPSLEELRAKGLVVDIDLEALYLREVQVKFDLQNIRTAGIRLAYDAMYGAGRNIVQRILPHSLFLHCSDNPGFDGQAPEPIHRNLGLLSETVARDASIACGLANDGDADRIGMYDRNGNFVDSHKILLLLVHYLHHYKKMSGKVVVTFSVTDKVKKLCDHYGLECQVTKIGFKYIAEIMTHEEVLVGGEESGGIAVAGHIPERDGVWIGLLLMEFMAKTGKTLTELLEEVYEIVGPFAFDRDDLHLPNEQKLAIVDRCAEGSIKQLGDYPVARTESIDGFKFYLRDDAWVMIRPSGTEPVLRVYAQAPTSAEVRQILNATHQSLLQ